MTKESQPSPSSTDNAALPYSAFTPARRYLILAVVAYCGILAPFSSTSFMPSIQVIAHELDVSLSAINNTLSAFLYAMAVFPLMWSSLGDKFGRKPIYIISMVVFLAGSIGCALSKTFGALVASRVIQSAGSSSILSVGAGTIADVFEREKRGTAMGLYFMGAMLGPPLAPIVGGAVGQHLGWRAIFWMLTIMAGVATLLLVGLVPETHRRILKERGVVFEDVAIPPPPVFKENNPVHTLMYVFSVPVAVIVFHNSMLFGCHLAMSTSLTYVMQGVYGLSQTVTGITYLGLGCGALVGSVVGGRFVDFTLRRERIRLENKAAAMAADDEKGLSEIAPVRVPPQIRIRYLWVGAVIYIGCSIGYGWMAEKGNVALAGILIVHFICGFCVSWQLSAASNFLIDMFPAHGSRITAAQMFFRSIWSGVCCQIVITIEESIGWGYEFTIFGLLVVLSFLFTIPIAFVGVRKALFSCR